MFYQKYRPQTLKELDNLKVKEKLIKILSSKRIPHALLFTGPKGTGKTSAARIFSKVINCEKNLFSGKNDSIEPCNLCYSCKTITISSSPDIIEIDAASNRGIDEIRQIINQVKFYPLQTRYKVYIIDEVHMLTKEAFNALLKTLEEPPKSVVFILATTEEEKMPTTIVSRCIKINFSKAQPSEIYNMLQRIVKNEKIDFPDEVLQYLSKHSDNSFRDAAKILEELTIEINNDKKKSDPLVVLKTLLGYHGNHLSLINFLEKKDQEKALDFVEKYDQEGGDIKYLVESLMSFFHQLLLRKNGLSNDLDSDYDFKIKEISIMIKLLQEAYQTLKFSPIDSLPLEIAIVDYCQKQKGGEQNV